MVQLNTTGFDMKGTDTAHYDTLNSFRIMLCVVTCFSKDTLGRNVILFNIMLQYFTLH